MTIYDVDQNFSVNSNLELPDVKFYNVLCAPFSVHGVFYEDGKFRRLPEQVARDTNDGVWFLHHNTAGGRVRFCTDSPYIAIHAEMPVVGFMPHFSLTGSACFDLYVRNGQGTEQFAGSFMREANNLSDYEFVLRPAGTGMREYTVNFPTYSSVSALYIGLSENACVEAPKPYERTKPVVFYGSSITQGACSCRPGLAYESILSRRFDFDYINLGFSGNARAEQVMADYIAGLDMSVFVMDYDYNAPTVEHLAQTHQAFFQTVRAAHPQIPVIMMARPHYHRNSENLARSQVIRATYDAAIGAGDTNVYFLDGPELMKMAKDDGLVDGVHPNDFGFASMAEAVGAVMETIYG